MSSVALKVGDKVIVSVEKESRKWGYDPCPDGTEATVVGFGEAAYGRILNVRRAPGIYENRSWALIQLPDGGAVHKEFYSRLTLANEAEIARRTIPNHHRAEKLLRPLPETAFYEGDLVRSTERANIMPMIDPKTGMEDDSLFVVTRVNYLAIKAKAMNGMNWPFYDLSNEIDAEWSTPHHEEALTLVARGNVWKYYHQEPLVFFGGIAEEAKFFLLLGHYEEVLNPENGVCSWTKRQAMAAIQDKIAHGIIASNNKTFRSDHPIAIRFRDESLGRRVSDATLKGFML